MGAFFRVSTHPANLALFRIVIFGVALAQAFDPSGDIVWYGSIPTVLRVGPPGWGALAEWIPMGPFTTRLLLSVFVVASCMTIVGFKTKPAAIVAAATGFYVLGVPQFFGKLNHNHHVVWFMAILAASPCGDALSLDARGRQKTESIAYGFPLRVCWFLIGLVYFFPGFWKLVSVGPAWALSENVKYMMYDKWTELGGFMPFWRADQHPWAYRIGGIFTLVFEIGFLPVMLFSPRLRPWFIAAGPAFHFQTFLFMKIGFYVLVVCYVVFVDWPESIRRRRPILMGSPSEAAKEVPSGSTDALPATAVPSKTLQRLAITLIVGNLVAGFAAVDSYPFAVYPRFNRLQPHQATYVEVIASDAHGREWRVDDTEIKTRFSTSRWARLLRRLSKLEGPAKEASLKALIRVLGETTHDLRGAKTIRIDAVEHSIRPDDWGRNPVARNTLGSFSNTQL
jgi:hypothetical protein